MFFLRKQVLPWIAPFLLVAVAGCGGGGIKKVSGTLKYKGQPVPNCHITFNPENGRPSDGDTDEQGRFTLRYDPKQDGAVAGKHKVWVRPNATANSVTEPGMAPKPPKEWAEFYAKYGGEKSNKEVMIDKSTSDLVIDFD
jgi:hypothetical protein